MASAGDSGKAGAGRTEGACRAGAADACWRADAGAGAGGAGSPSAAARGIGSLNTGERRERRPDPAAPVSKTESCDDIGTRPDK
jgi:hypothetical protein